MTVNTLQQDEHKAYHVLLIVGRAEVKLPFCVFVTVSTVCILGSTAGSPDGCRPKSSLPIDALLLL